MDFQLELYGKGPLREPMALLASRSNAAGKIKIHDAVAYRPDLQRIAKQADLFICCHVQGDPSCTYLETFACGVPIVGYANEMWTPLSQDSGPARLSLKAIIKRSPKQWLGFWAHLVSRNCRSELATLPRRTPWRSHGTGVSRTWLPSFEFLTSA